MKLEFLPQLSCFDRKRGLILPKIISNDLAEFLGILAGDGCIAKYVRGRKVDYWISIVGNSIDDEKYIKNHVIPLIKNLFNINPKIYEFKKQKTIRISIRSKGLFNFLKTLGMNIGPKKNIHIPYIIKMKRNFFFSFLRGFMDTDGSVYLRNGNYPVLSNSQKSRKIIEEIELYLKNFGFSTYVNYNIVRNDKRGFTSTGHRIYLYGHKNFRKWLELIGFNNPKNIEKCSVWGRRDLNT